MNKEKISRFSAQTVVSAIMKWGSIILFIAAIIVLAYLSFVDDFQINASVRNISTIALVALVLNWLIWDTYYKSNYDKILAQDVKNTEYCIHKRYYFARKGWKQKELQQKIKQYNADFREAWLQDVEDLLGRSRQEIEEEPYKGNSHKLLIWRIKHHKIPTSGLKSSREMTSVLQVGTSGSSKISVKKAEHYHTALRIQKFCTALLSTGLAASLVYDFISEGITGALLKLLLNVVLLFCSMVFGSMAGIKGAKMKLNIAEEVSELLEEWKNEPPIEEPYKEEIVKRPEETEEQKDKESNKSIIVIE